MLRAAETGQCGQQRPDIGTSIVRLDLNDHGQIAAVDDERSAAAKLLELLGARHVALLLGARRRLPSTQAAARGRAYVDPVTGAETPTSRGILHYGKKGIHTVPSRPR